MTVASYANLPLACPRCGERMRFLYARTPSGDIAGDTAAAKADTIYIYACSDHGTFAFNRDIPIRPRS